MCVNVIITIVSKYLTIQCEKLASEIKKRIKKKKYESLKEPQKKSLSSVINENIQSILNLVHNFPPFIKHYIFILYIVCEIFVRNLFKAAWYYYYYYYFFFF